MDFVPGAPSCQAALHEAWRCPALKDLQQEVDPDLMLLDLDNSPAQILLGILSQLPADYVWDFFTPLGGATIPEGQDDLLH